MKQDTMTVSGDRIAYRHNGLEAGRQTILMIHGLGESSLCFQEAFEELEWSTSKAT